MTNLQSLLKIDSNRLDAINSVLLDPNSRVMKDFLDVVAKYGTPEEINRKHRESRKMENLEHVRIFKNGLQTRRFPGLGINLNDMGIAVSRRQLDHAQAVPARVQPHGFRVNGNGGSGDKIGRQIATVEFDGHEKGKPRL